MVTHYIQEHYFLLFFNNYFTPFFVCVDGSGEKNSFRALHLKEVLFFKNKGHFILCNAQLVKENVFNGFYLSFLLEK